MSKTSRPVPFPNSYWVAPGKLLAGEHPEGMDAAESQTRLEAMLEVGIRTFVDLTEPHETGETAVHETGYPRLLHRLSEERELEITRVIFPILDHHVPSRKTMRSILDVLDASIAHGDPAYVHCFMGVGRTGTVVGCYLRRHGLATSLDVVERITALRSMIPNALLPSPYTADQTKMVRAWREQD